MVWRNLSLASLWPIGCLLSSMLVGAGAVCGQERGGTAGEGGQFVLGVEPYGREPYPLVSRGGRLGYTVADDKALTLTYVEAQRDVLLSTLSVREYELRLDQRLGSFVVYGLGVGSRQVDLQYDVFVEGAEDAQSINERRQAVIAGAHLGCEFDLADWLVVGSDLYSATVPLRWAKGGDDYPEGAESFEDDPKTNPYIKSAFGVSLQLVRTYVALRF